MPEGYSKPFQICKMMRHIENATTITTVYSGIFRYIQRHSAIFSHVLAYWRTLTQKTHDAISTFKRSVHLWVKLFIQNVILRVSARKISSIFSVELFSCAFDKILSKRLSCTKTQLPWKSSGRVPALRHESFYKTLHFKRLTVFWIGLRLDNCLVICTVMLCTALGTFRILAYYLC